MPHGGVLVVIAIALGAGPAGATPLAQHPDNRHLLQWDGRPTVLVASGEHYGAVVNLDFDFVPYLDELKRSGLNLTRVFTGAYVEDAKAFGIAENTLAPRAARFIAPWARSRTPGYAGGGNRFDLTRWDPVYLRRLDAFVREAGRRGIVVELVLFCPFYEEAQWALSPLNAVNNVNGVGKVTRAAVYTLRDAALQAIQEALVRKLVTTLNAHDNLYFEICNEPYTTIREPAGESIGATMDWQHRIAEVIAQTERALPKRHLVAQNISNGSAKAPADLHPAVSILNFHYATPPTAVAENWALGKVLADDETGFRGTGDEAYRLEAWDFLLAGGAIFSHLDYSFTARDERGRGPLPARQPGGGGPSFRRQMRVLRGFLEGLDLARMAPAQAILPGLPDNLSARALVVPGRQYAAYLRPRTGRMSDYVVQWAGSILPRATGPTTIHAVANDGVRVWLDGLPVIDDWSEHTARDSHATVTMTAGKPVRVRMEYFQASGGAVARLMWTPPGGAKAIIPKTQLLDPDGKTGGLEGRYFQDREFRAWATTRIDPTIDFDWSESSPFSPAPARGARAAALPLELPSGGWRATWIDPQTGDVIKEESFTHAGGARRLASPSFAVDVAVRVVREN